ncbi:hypothetical protein AVEN_165377-1 [Araneus ventricosus]|uniref:Uncharacterized protein n=1 Tax=Araneus ventricosus TaxID=182803 RepID=A0A4Y2AT34_ARAVE|nr:hypothetical protein AVEN_165377-1 [Araneus ventricosus]
MVKCRCLGFKYQTLALKTSVYIWLSLNINVQFLEQQEAYFQTELVILNQMMRTTTDLASPTSNLLDHTSGTEFSPRLRFNAHQVHKHSGILVERVSNLESSGPEVETFILRLKY